VAATKNIDIISKQLRKKIGDLDTDETISIPVKNCAIVTKTLTGREQCHEFAQFLTQPEKEWLVEEVRLFLKKLRSQIE